MEQIKPYLAMLKKQHFWVLSGIVTIAAIVCWFMAASNLKAEFDANLSNINSKTEAVKQVAGKQDHPNDKWQAGLKSDNDKQKADVLAAWEKRFQEQLKVPQWPRDVFGEQFVSHIEKIGPKGEIETRYRELYQNYVKEAMEPLFSIVDYRKLDYIRDKDGKPLVPTTGAGGGGLEGGALGGGAGGPPTAAGAGTEWKGIVAWPEASRLAFSQRYNWVRTPTTLQVRYANEDLWVMTALLKIIAETNKDVKEHLLAKVKAIDAINIGQLVPPPEQFLALMQPGAALGGEGAAPDSGVTGGGALPGMVTGGEAGAEGAAPQTGAAMIDAQLSHGRYVDSKGNPVAHGQPDPFAEFKIMPFQMRLVMDQRRVPEFLVNCANSPLPIEVRQVKITARNYQPVDVGETQQGSGLGGGMGDGGMGGGIGGGKGMGGGGMGGLGGGGLGGLGGGGLGGLGGSGLGGLGGEGGGLGLGGGSGGSQGQGGGLGGEIEMSNYDLNVDIRGFVYIFNFPDKTKLNTGAEQLNVAPPDPTQAAPGGPPVPVPPAAGPPAGDGQAAPTTPAPAVPGAVVPGTAPPVPAEPAGNPPAATTPPPATNPPPATAPPPAGVPAPAGAQP